MAGSKEEYEKVLSASIEDFKAGRFVDFDLDKVGLCDKDKSGPTGSEIKRLQNG